MLAKDKTGKGAIHWAARNQNAEAAVAVLLALMAVGQMHGLRIPEQQSRYMELLTIQMRKQQQQRWRCYSQQGQMCRPRIAME